jgi:hypothetical protein
VTQPTATLSQEKLGEIQVLARLLVDYDAEIEAKEEALKALKENARRVREESLPTAMAEVGLTSIKLSNGEKVDIKKDVYASISNDAKPRAYQWLEENGFGALIKTEVSIAFGREEREAAQQLQQELSERGLNANAEASVHPQTLKAFLREQIENARPNLPLELFGARPVNVAKVTLPKAK